MSAYIPLALKILKHALIIWLLFILAVSTIASLVPTPISQEKKDKLNQTNFYGSQQDGPDRIALVETATDAFGARLELLKEAKESLDIVYHTIADGETTSAFFAAVLEAADRGVEVRIIVDGKVGLANGHVRKIFNALEAHESISCRMYNPLKVLEPWTLHSIFHDKFIIADNQYVLIGGRNLDDRFYNPNSFAKADVYDRDVLVWDSANAPDSSVKQLTAYMDQLWEYENTKPFVARAADEQTYRQLADAAVALHTSNPQYFEKTLADYKDATLATKKISLMFNPINNTKKEPWLAYQVLNLARSAKDSIWIQTPYATANKDLLAALTEAGKLPEAVFLTNSMASTPNFPAFSNYISQRQKFLNTGFTIYEYQSDTSLHSKSILIDDRLSIVGSLNMDDRSFYLDTETMLAVDSTDFAAVLKEAMSGYASQSLVVSADNNEYIADQNVAELPVPWFKRALMWIVSIFSRLFQALI